MREPTSPRRPVKPYLADPLTVRQRWKYRLLIGAWVGLALFFWGWWLSPDHVLSWGRYGTVTAAIFWIFFLQVYFLAMFLRARRSAATLEDLGEFRAAMVVTKTPSEPFSVVERTLRAMLAQTVPHDTWLADEDPSPDTIAWCREHGVKISTRRGHPEYHRDTWPRRKRCKEGNLAFFYDTYGYRDYDFVSQLDADHAPEPDYLHEMLKPFADPAVGYVSAPSICSRNARESWAARTRLNAEAMFHGVLQSGYTAKWAPMCIGSHYAVRTRALQDVGGLGPELAEDHSTSMILNAGGWRGAHAIDAIAVGDGPGSYSDMITQEFQWSRSLVSLLLRYTPRYLGSLPARLKFQFVFSQLWYPLFACFMALMYAMPILALLFDIRFANVTYPGFIAHAAPPVILLIWIAAQIQKDGLFRPTDAKVLSWEKALFATAQWPWVLWGTLMAVRDRITGEFVDFRITPKGEAVRTGLPLRAIAPHALLTVGALAPVVLVDQVQEAKGFYILSLVNVFLYLSLCLVILFHDQKENQIPMRDIGMRGALQYAAALVLFLVAGSALWVRSAESVYALTAGLEPLQVTETKFVVSGAGQGAPGTVKYTFGFDWTSEGVGKWWR